MGIRNLYAISDPAFSEFVYYMMINCPPEVRGQLNPMELRYFRTKKNIRNFADKETLERRITMLTRIGVRWSMMFYKDGLDPDLFFKEVGTDYPFAKKNTDLIEIFRKGEAFVFGSKTTSMMALLAEQGSHSQNYVLDYGYLRSSKVMAGIVRRQESKIDDAEQTYADMAKVVIHAVDSFNDLIEWDGITKLNLRILLVLLGYRNQFVTARTMKSRLGVAATNKTTPRVLNQMVKSGLVYETKVPEIDWEKKAYTISEKGQAKVMDFLKFVQEKIHARN